MLFGWNQVPCQKYIDRLIAECNRGIEAQQIFQFLCLKAGLLLQLTVSALNLRLSGIIQLACGNFQSEAVQRISVLAYHQELSLICYRHHSGSPVMVNVIPVSLMAIGKNRVLINL